MTICSWDSIYGLLNNYFCRKSADGILDCRKIAECLQKKCRLFADGILDCRKIAEKVPTNSTPSPPRSTTSPLGVGMTSSPCPALCPALPCPGLPALPPAPARRPLPSALCPTLNNTVFCNPHFFCSPKFHLQTICTFSATHRPTQSTLFLHFFCKNNSFEI